MSWDTAHYPDNWKELSEQIKKRDKYTCQRCGANAPSLVTHHRVTAREEDHSPDNLITLCQFCHQFLHNDKAVCMVRPVKKTVTRFKTCPRCEKEFDYDCEDKFCPECGAFLESEKRCVVEPIDIYSIDRSRDSWFFESDNPPDIMKVIYDNRMDQIRRLDEQGLLKMPDT